MALSVSIVCTLISVVAIFFALRILADSMRMKKKNEEQGKFFRH